MPQKTGKRRDDRRPAFIAEMATKAVDYKLYCKREKYGLDQA
jgi:hypothetical protein